MKKQNVVILGSTGSVGTAALDVMRRLSDRFRVIGLSTRHRIDLLSGQIEEFSPRFAAIQDDEAAGVFKEKHQPASTEVFTGDKGVARLAAIEDADIVVNAVVGAAGLVPTLRALEQGKRVALANKESLVIGGELVMKTARDYGGEIIPVDSEHSSLHQCLDGIDRDDVERIIITASGGPLLDVDKSALAGSTPAQVLAHPTWKMGQRITVDSATMMNKGFEVIEARWLFDIDFSRISVLIHPQAMVHGLVEFIDGTTAAVLTTPDMRIPIQRALCYPEKVASGVPRIDLARTGKLVFSEPDPERFPCLGLALRAGVEGGTVPAALNSADEVVVEAFVGNRISFGDIPAILAEILGTAGNTRNPDLDAIVDAGRRAGERAGLLVIDAERRMKS